MKFSGKSSNVVMSFRPLFLFLSSHLFLTRGSECLLTISSNVFKQIFPINNSGLKEELDSSHPRLTRIILDVLKTHVPSLVEFGYEISRVRGVSRVEVELVEVDAETDSIRLIIEGEAINYEELEKTVRKLGAAIHSVDGVVIENTKKR